MDRQPLAQKRIVVTRTSTQATSLVQALHAQGAEVLCWPLLEIQPVTPLPPEPVLGDFAWLLLTSQNALRFLCERIPPEALRAQQQTTQLKVACVGKKTEAAVRQHGIEVHVVPQQARAKALLQALQPYAADLAQASCLFPCSALAGTVLEDGLRALGAEVLRWELYTSTRAAISTAQRATRQAQLRDGEIDAVTLMSPSAVHALVGLLASFEPPSTDEPASAKMVAGSDDAEALAHRAVDDVDVLARGVVDDGWARASVWVSIGPTTSEALEECGFLGIVQAGHASTQGIVQALVSHVGAQQDFDEALT